MARILIVDDVAVIRDPIAAALRLRGHQADTAANGFEAIDRIVANRPDLILLDVVMPMMDGPTLLRKLREAPATADIPVILLSATVDKNVIIKAARLGVQDYMLKSKFLMSDLLDRVARRVKTQPPPPPPPPAETKPAPSRFHVVRVPTLPALLAPGPK